MIETVTGFAALALLGFAIAFALLMLFMVLVQPIWCLVDCAIDNKRGTASKVVWIILLVLMYGLANWFYGAFAAAGGALRRLTRLAWLFAIALVVTFLIMFWNNVEFRRGIEREWNKHQQLVVLATSAPPASNR
ncbi:MAG TPA: hypothetical protein PLR35_16995 [Burkholderiaceae bacterium]|nr:hypothetical protein [Burkholderiaceae bacterium]